MNPNADQTKSLLDAWNILNRYRWRFLLATFGVMTGLLVGSFLLPRKYTAQAIFERRTDMVLTEIMNHGASQSFWDSQRSSLAEEIAGQIAIDHMIESLNASDRYAHLIRNKTPFELNDFRTEVVRRVTVRFDIGTKEFDRIRVGFLHSNPRLASAVVNTLVENYIDRTRRMIDGRLEKTAEFFQSEVNRNRRLSESLENQKLTFELDHAELLPEFPGSIQLRLTETQRELTEAQQERDAIAMRVTALQKMIESTPAVVPQVITKRNPELEDLESQLRSLKSKEQQFQNVLKMKRKHPDLIAIKEQVAAIEQKIANTAEEVITQKHLGANRQRQDLEVELTSALTTLRAKEQQAESFETQLAELSVRSTQLFPVRSDYRKLARKIEKAQRQQAFWENNLRRVQMALTAEAGQRGIRLEFVKPGTINNKPVSPNLVQVLLATVAMGIAAGCVNVFIAYRSDDSFCNGEQLTTAFNLPLIGAVSEVISSKQRRERKIRNLIVYPLNASAMAAVLITVVGLLYINLEKPLLYERFRGERASLRQITNPHRAAPVTTVDQE